MGLGLKRLPFQRKTTLDATSISPASSSDVAGKENKVFASGSEPARSDDEVDRNLRNFEQNHQYDPNLPEDYQERVHGALKEHDVGAEAAIEQGLNEQSPYPEVQAAVRNYDEDVPANTIRAWVIGMVLTTLGSGLNMLFSMRSPSITITSIVAQLIAYPLGNIWTKVMPTKTYTTFGIKWSLNPGPFNMKEHTIIVVMANCSFGGGAAYSTDTLLAQQAFYGQNFGWGFKILFTLTTQMLGYGLAGLGRRFLVWPAAMIWPSNLVNTTLFYALHDHSPTDPNQTGGWTIGRYRYFLYVFLGSFVWYWFPGWIFQALSVFAFVTWIKPNSVVINQLFGGSTGLSLIPITFDWTQISGYVLSPLIPPWHAIANTLVGTVGFYWIVTLAVHYSGAWYADYLPMSDSSSYDNTGSTYNVSKILTSEYELDEQAYRNYSPLFLSTTFAISYGISFATVISLIVHTALYNGKEIWLRAKLAREQEDDVHMRLMKKYPDAPDWWYLAMFVIMLGLSFATMYGWDTHLTWWSFIVAIIIPIIWSVPIGMIQAITNIAIGLNVLTEFIVGYMQPGKPLAMMMFKTYGYITMSQGLSFIQDLKLGHYMKIPPRTMFWTQTVATIWSCIVQIAVMNWALGAISDVCDHANTNHFTCPNGRVFFNASIIWGLLGPGRIFSSGQVYHGALYFFLIGAFMPIIFYLLARWKPKSFFRYMMAPVILGSTGSIPPATPLNYLSWGFVGWIFNRIIKNRNLGWWKQYNYVTSAGLDSGLAISTIIIFFALYLTNANPPDWWGNNVVETTLDMQGAAVKKVVNATLGEYFGPRKGSWS